MASTLTQCPDTLDFLWNSKTWEKTIELLEDADSEISILFPWITYDLLVDKLIYLKRKNPAIKIQVLTGTNSDNDWHIKNVQKLDKAGVTVRIIYKPFPHAKVICINRKILIEGSMNASFNAAHNNIECGIITSSKEICDKFCEGFDSMWNQALFYGANLVL